jgi:protein gp37
MTMAEVTKIQWTDHTFNPWIGCSKVHAGCAHCYAEADMDTRRGRAKWGPQGTRSRTSDANWKLPLKWDRAAKLSLQSWEYAVQTAVSEYDQVEPYERPRVFCASLADVFEAWDGPICDAKGNVWWYMDNAEPSQTSNRSRRVNRRLPEM